VDFLDLEKDWRHRRMLIEYLDFLGLRFAGAERRGTPGRMRARLLFPRLGLRFAGAERRGTPGRMRARLLFPRLGLRFAGAERRGTPGRMRARLLFPRLGLRFAGAERRGMERLAWILLRIRKISLKDLALLMFQP
jgi:hypothetical protein